MMDKWNQLCFNVKKHKEKNSNEEFFQAEIVNFFEKLGWSQHTSEILIQYRIPVGTGSVIADIVVKNTSNLLFVVELKRPNLQPIEKHYEQLNSYVKLLSLSYGILIGDSIQLYYNEPNNSNKIVKVFETNFTENNEDGARFIELFSKTTYNAEVLSKFCEIQLEKVNDANIASDIVNDLICGDGIDKITSILSTVLSVDYNENIINLVIDNLNISLTRKTNHRNKAISLDDSLKNVGSNKYEKLSIELIPSDPLKFAELFDREGSAILSYHYNDGRIIEKIWEKRFFSIEDSNVIGNLRSRPEARKGKWKEMGISKLVCRIEGQNKKRDN